MPEPTRAATSDRQRSAADVIESSETVTYLRALTAREPDPAVRNPDALARHFLPPLWRAALLVPLGVSRYLVERQAPGSYYYSIARARFMDEGLDEAIERGDLEQVVILGAGNDTRAYRFSDRLGSARVFELDFPANQERKRRRVRQLLGKLPDRVTFVPVDFSRQSLDEVLRAAGYAHDRPTFFLFEGVSYYLPRARVEAILRFAAATSAPGSTISFDYSIRSFVEGDVSSYGAAGVARWLEQIGEPFLWGLEPAEVESFVRACGLEPVVDLGSEELADRYVRCGGGARDARLIALYRMLRAAVPEPAAPRTEERK